MNQGLRFTQLEIAGFRHIMAKTAIPLMEFVNTIVGGNRKGKTTLSEAIVWALFACDLQGGTKGVFDVLKNNQAKETAVTLGFETYTEGDIASYTVHRIRKGRKTDLFLNGEVAKQADIESLLGERDMFLSIFVPGYFGMLSNAKARDILMKYLPKLESHQVMEQLPAEDVQRFDPLELINPNHSLKQMNQDIKELNADEQRVSGKIEYLRVHSMLPVPKKKIDEDQQRLERLQSEIREMASPIDEPELMDLQSLEQEKQQLGAQYRAKYEQFQSLKASPIPQVGDRCSECGHVLDAAEVREHIQKSKQRLHALASDCEVIKKQGFALNVSIEQGKKENEARIAAYELQRGKDVRALQVEIEQLQALQSERQEKMKLAKDLQEYEAIAAEIETDLAEKQATVQSLKNYLLKYAELQVEAIHPKLQHAEVQLCTFSKDGEMKLDFTLLYDRKPYSVLCNSERVLCSLEIASYFNEVRGASYPIYIDNAESLESFDAPNTQHFVARMVPKSSLIVNEVPITPHTTTPSARRVG